MVSKEREEHYKKIRENEARLKNLRETRNVGIKFPYKCTRCGNLTKKITTGKWKGTYHCNECDSYQEWLAHPAFSIPTKKRK